MIQFTQTDTVNNTAGRSNIGSSYKSSRNGNRNIGSSKKQWGLKQNTNTNSSRNNTRRSYSHINSKLINSSSKKNDINNNRSSSSSSKHPCCPNTI
jgi:hypothetical protein